MSQPDAPRARAVREQLDALTQRVEGVLSSLAPDQEVRPWVAGVSGGVEGSTPNWLLLPIILHRCWGAEETGSIAPSTLDDVLWGQYALFLHVRILDDLLDGHRNDLRLALVGDYFLLESLESLRALPALDCAAFRKFHRDRLRDTLKGALEVRQLESVPGQFTRQHLPLHARVNAIFKMATAAVCHLHSRAGESEWIFRLQDRLAVFGQVWDDFQDLWSDLEEDRFTWVGNTLLEGWGDREPRGGRGWPLAKWALLDPDGTRPVIEELTGIAETAWTELPPDAPAAVRELVQDLKGRPEALDRLLHRARLQSVFGEEMMAHVPEVSGSG